MTGRGVLALDLGTTSVRALFVGADGGIESRASRPLGARFPAPGHVEQDPEELWSQSLEVLREALASAGATAREAAAIGVVAQRATALAWDSGGTPLAPALGWQDRRTAPRVAPLRTQGIPITTQASATKFEWLLKENPGVKKAAAEGRLRLGTPDVWLTWKLTGGSVHATEIGHASCTALYDPASHGWSPGLCALFSVPEDSLPQILPTSAIVGETPAALLGSPVPVAARAGDQEASAFAQGVHRPGDAKLTLGTSAMLDVHTGGEPGSFEDGCVPLGLWEIGGERSFCREGSVTTAGAAVDWLAGLGIAGPAEAGGAALDALARTVPDAAGVVFVPSLEGLGSPHQDDGATGLLLGLTRGSTGAHLARAVFEGVAHRCADLVEVLVPGGPVLRVDGGLARSHLLLQAIADFAGCTVRRAAEVETTALGGAFLAGISTGVYESAEACAALVRVDADVTPRLSAAARTSARASWARAVARARS